MRPGFARALFLFAATASVALAQPSAEEAELLRRLDALKTIGEKNAAATQAANTAARPPDGRIKVQPLQPVEEKLVPQSAPTEITATKEATFDEKTRIAVFVGNVRVKDPQFNLAADKLTAFMKRPPPPAKTGPAADSDEPSAPGEAGKDEGGGLDRAIAEGRVVITQDKPGEAGKPPVRYVGRGKKVDYNAATGEVTLSGNPQVQQGINTHVATEESTVMIMQKDGRMITKGGSRTVIVKEQDKPRSP